MADWFQAIADRFTLDQQLGADESGESWRGHESSTGRAVLLRLWTTLPAQRRLLADRLASLKEMKHPSLLVPLHAGVQEQGLVVVRPWISNTVAETVSGLSIDEKLAMEIRLAEALHAAHAAGVIHGRVHEGNVFMDDRGMIQVADFGFPGVSVGSKSAWQSPQCRAGATPEATDDVYSMGVMIYRWFTGDDPGSPLPEVARLDELRARQRRGLELPAQLARLLAATLSADPGHRPHSMLELREQLEDARLAMLRARDTGLEENEADWQPPARLLEPVPETTSESTPGRFSLTRILLPVAAVVAMIALILVLWILPAQVEREQLARREENQAMATLMARVEQQRAEQAAQVEQQQPLTPEQLEAMLASKQAAEDLLDEFIQMRLELEDRSVEVWGAQPFAEAQAFRVSGNEPFRQQQFDLAGDIYSQSLGQLQAVQALGDMVLADALERGKQALLRGRSEKAIEVFTLASLIETDNSWARTGLKRAQTLDQVLALTARADESELASDWPASLEFLQQARELDPLTEGLDQRIKNTRTTIADIAFRSAMSSGLAAIEAERWAAARNDLQRARKMRPSDPAPRNALLEVDRRFRETGIEHHRSLAEESVASEKWATALKHFEQVLERDANLRFAQEGKDLASLRVDLDQRLVEFNRAPQRWWSEDGRKKAADLLSEARAIDTIGPRLGEQIQRLEHQLDLASRPVEVTLLSDNVCNVVVYKIGRLGHFDSHQLRLQPGRYTAVGTRDGYRDVRKDFLVHAQRGADPVVVRCEEEV